MNRNLSCFVFSIWYSSSDDQEICKERKKNNCHKLLLSSHIFCLHPEFHLKIAIFFEIHHTHITQQHWSEAKQGVIYFRLLFMKKNDDD